MFKLRAISFPLLLVLLALIVYWQDNGVYIVIFLAPLIAGALLYEVTGMVKALQIETYRKSLVIGGALLFFLLFGRVLCNQGLFRFLSMMISLVPVILFACCWLVLLFAADKKAAFSKMLYTISLGFIVLFPLFLMMQTYFGGMPLPMGPRPLFTGARNLLFLILVTKAMDTGGYIAGMLSSRYMKNGNHKMIPAVSPNKSWEGTAGGLVLSVGVSLIFWAIYSDAPYCRLPQQMLGFSVWWYVLAGVLLGIGSLAGDLTESALKRASGVKDSGKLIPGMGGVFDVFDSFLFNGMLFFVLAAFKF